MIIVDTTIHLFHGVINLIMLHNNELISIEEILVKPQNNHERPIRQFILFNRNTDLKICIYTLGARVMSCMLSEHEIVTNNENETMSTTSTAMHNVFWDSHVFGFDTILLNCRQNLPNEPDRTLTYCLTKDNEFIIEGNCYNLINIRTLLFNPFFFNLVI